MSDAKKFKEWYGDRCGHPLGVSLGMKAVIELEQENTELKLQLKDAIGAMKASKALVLDIDEKYEIKSVIDGHLMSDLLDESINEAKELLNK